MEKETITKAAELLQQASSMLLSIDEDSKETNSRTNRPATNIGAPRVASSQSSSSATAVPEIRETLERAKSMMASSSNAGLYRRLNQNERLRASRSSSSRTSLKQSSSSKKEKTVRNFEQKPFEFALLRQPEVDSDGEPEDDTLKKDNVINRGIVTLCSSDTEKIIRSKIVSSLQPKYPLLENRDIEFVKVVQKKISVLQLGKGTEYDYKVVKKLAGQGLLYIRVRKAMQFAIDDDSLVKEDIEDDSLTPLELRSPFDQPTTSTVSPADPIIVPDGSSLEQTRLDKQSPEDVQDFGPTVAKIELPLYLSTVIDEIPPAVSDPTEMLRFLQNNILLGRDLDVTDQSCDISGETNYITVDRDDILETTFSELKDVKDPRITFEVQFYDEQAEDKGGPRKEWIRLCNQKIQLKYFEHGLKEHLESDYFYVGQMAAIALLQNGQLPVYFPESVLQDVFAGPYPSTNACIYNLQKGLDTLGIHAVGRKFPQFLYLLRPSENRKLSVKMLLHLLKPKFSEKGSNSLMYEKSVYACFVKYVREVASGRRITKLENILEFTTSASEEPILGFALSPSIEFVNATCTSSDERESQDQIDEPVEKKKIFGDFFPKSHTCPNILILPRRTQHLQLSSEEVLFDLYDNAFLSNYFGRR